MRKVFFEVVNSISGFVAAQRLLDGQPIMERIYHGLTVEEAVAKYGEFHNYEMIGIETLEKVHEDDWRVAVWDQDGIILIFGEG